MMDIIFDLQIGKEIVKVSLFADNLILYLKDQKTSTPKLLDTIQQLQQCSRIQNQLTKISGLSTPTMNKLRKNIENNST
jgi:uncharacterized protein YcbK (DUF882 family)